MGISLKIEITSPLTPDDRDLLSGIAVMTLAIANREMAENRFPDTFPPDEEVEPVEEPQPCGSVEYITKPSGDHATGKYCVSPVGHRGRHRFRRLNININSVLESLK